MAAGLNQERITQIDAFFNDITNSSYMDGLNQYSDSAGHVAGRGSFTGHDIVSDATSPAAGGTVSDTQIRSMLDSQITHGLVPHPNGNQLYVVFTPSDVTVTDSGGTSGQQFDGFHSSFTDSQGDTVHYALVVGGILPSMTEVASHEMVEAITDPEPNSGWYDPTKIDPKTGLNNGEIADLGYNQTGVVNGYTVAQYWSNTANSPVSPAANAKSVNQGGVVTAITTDTDVWGNAYVFGIGTDAKVYYNTQEFAGNWSGWTSLGAPEVSYYNGHYYVVEIGAKSISVTNDGSVWRVFAIGPDNAVYTVAEGDSSWTRLGGSATQVAAARSASGALAVFAVGTDNYVYEDVRTGSGSGGWAGTSWSKLPGQTTQAQSLVVDASTGKAEVFVIGLDNTVHTVEEALYISRYGFRYWGWGNWVALPQVAFGVKSIAVETTADGREEVFAINQQNYVDSIRQDAPDDWSSSNWHPLGDQQAKSISVSHEADGREIVFAIDTTGTVWAIHQSAPNDGWEGTSWFSLGLHAKAVAAVFNHHWSNGLASAAYDDLTVATIDPNTGALGTAQQTLANGGWN
jgi:hypothetical protein